MLLFVLTDFLIQIFINLFHPSLLILKTLRIMTNQGKILTGLFAGAAVGAVIALIMCSDKENEIKNKISDWASDVVNHTKDLISKTKSKASDTSNLVEKKVSAASNTIQNKVNELKNV